MHVYVGVGDTNRNHNDFFISICLDDGIVCITELFRFNFNSLADRFVYGISNIIEKMMAARYTITLIPIVITVCN